MLKQHTRWPTRTSCAESCRLRALAASRSSHAACSVFVPVRQCLAFLLAWSVLVPLGCAEESNADASDPSDAASDARVVADDDAGASDVSAPRICTLTTQAAVDIKESACTIRVSHPDSSSPIYHSLAKLEAGIVDNAERCQDQPLAWVLKQTASGTNLVACDAACERSATLFPSFVAAIKPLAGCGDPKLIGALCELPELSFPSISESSCVLPIVQPEERSMAYAAADIRGAPVVESHDDCEAEPLAMFPNQATNPTQLVACDQACLRSASLFPAFVAAAWSLLGCGDGVVGGQ